MGQVKQLQTKKPLLRLRREKQQIAILRQRSVASCAFASSTNYVMAELVPAISTRNALH